MSILIYLLASQRHSYEIISMTFKILTPNIQINSNLIYIEGKYYLKIYNNNIKLIFNN